MFKYHIPTHTLAEWKTQVMVDSNTATSLAIATAHAILADLEDTTPPHSSSDHHAFNSEEGNPYFPLLPTSKTS